MCCLSWYLGMPHVGNSNILNTNESCRQTRAVVKSCNLLIEIKAKSWKMLTVSSTNLSICGQTPLCLILDVTRRHPLLHSRFVLSTLQLGRCNKLEVPYIWVSYFPQLHGISVPWNTLLVHQAIVDYLLLSSALYFTNHSLCEVKKGHRAL